VAVVCLADDEAHRAAYLDCSKHDCGPRTVPAGPGYAAAAEAIGYKLHRLPTCPKRYIWASTWAVISNPAFAAGLHFKGPLRAGGALNQWSNLSRFVDTAKYGMDAMRHLRAAAKEKRRHANHH
jgi:hypothetical protein